MSAPILRLYQQRAIDLIDTAVATGKRSPLLVLPTGAGKTVVARAIMEREQERGHSALFLAPRRELVLQTSAKLSGLRHGVLLAGIDRLRDIYAPLQVGSTDTLLSRMVRRQRLVLQDFHLVIIDEAHLSVTAARKTLLDLWPNALKVGLTATPTRKDGRALGLLYDQLIEPVTVADLVRDGHLIRARYFSVAEPDLARVRTVAGDFNQGQLEEVMNRPKLVGDVVQHWLAHAAGRRTVVFGTGIKHSVALAEEFARHGVTAEHVDADTPQTLRDATFERFRNGRTQVLTNCFLASYGFDLPELSAVVLARPTKSLMLYLQMIGRGLRPAEGKTDCLVLDHSGCVHRFGFAHDERHWTLEGERALVQTAHDGSKREAAKQLTCPECNSVFSGARVCPECGYFFAPKGKPVRTLAGDLVEIGTGLPSEQIDRLAFFAELRGLATKRGYKAGFAAAKFKERFGHYPPRVWEDAPAAEPSQITQRWVLSRQIAWRKAQGRRA